MTTATAPMTAEELLALPQDDRVIRELFDGALKERRMTKRSYSHSRTQVAVSVSLKLWADKQLEPHPVVVGGEAAVRLKKNPDTFVGIDVGVIAGSLAAKTEKDARFIDGLPILIVEILSPTDRHRQVARKIKSYRKAGVPFVWLMDPDIELVTVFEQGKLPKGYNIEDTITGELHLPGFNAAVKELFA